MAPLLKRRILDRWIGYVPVVVVGPSSATLIMSVMQGTALARKRDAGYRALGAHAMSSLSGARRNMERRERCYGSRTISTGADRQKQAGGVATQVHNRPIRPRRYTGNGIDRAFDYGSAPCGQPIIRHSSRICLRASQPVYLVYTGVKTRGSSRERNALPEVYTDLS